MSEVSTIQSPTELSLQNLIDTRHEVQKLRFGNKVAGRDFPGQRLARQRGQGVEFLDLRQYVSGDDVRHIDWNVTARTNEPYTRLYRQEKEQSTIVIVDLRSIMFTGTTCLRAVAAGRLAAATLWQAAYNGDRCASIVISGDTVSASRPLTGNNGVLQALELIATGFYKTHQATLANNHSATNEAQLSVALDMIINNRRNTGNHLLFSGFDTGQDQHYNEEILKSAALKNLNAVLLLDRIELQGLPHGTYRYRHQNSSNLTLINSRSRKEFAKIVEKSINEKKRQLIRAGIDILATVSTVGVHEFLTDLQKQSWI